MAGEQPLRLLLDRCADLWYEQLPPTGRSEDVRAVYQGRNGEDLVGIIEYVGLERRGKRGTAYGWRPRLYGWTASRLRSQRDAALFLVRRRKNAGRTTAG